MTALPTYPMRSSTICRQPGRYIGWPTVAKGSDGTLHAVFSGDRDYHVCPFGKIFLTTSRDEGRTWSAPSLIQDTPLDDRDAGICICPDGTLVVSWFTSHYRDYRWLFDKFQARGDFLQDDSRWEAWEDKIASLTESEIRHWAPSYETPDEPNARKRFMGFWTMRSRDGGKTWDPPTNSPVYAPHGATVSPNGDLLLLGMKALSPLDGLNNIGFAHSCDQGLTWDLEACISGFPPYQGTVAGGLRRLGEPHVTHLPSGKLIGVARCEETGNQMAPLYFMESVDSGRTWTGPRATRILGKPAHLLTLADGRVLMTCGYRHAPFGQRAYVSDDEGATWTPNDGIILRDDGLNGDLGYASTAECADGTLVSVYYQIAHEGEKPSLCATRWRREAAGRER